MTDNQKSDFKTFITSKHGLMDLHIRETIQYRDLIMLFVKRDFTSRYKQTLLGPLWALIQPLLTTVVFTIIFGNLANLTTADIPGDFVIPGFLFYMAGSICWSYFSGTLSAVSGTFINNRNIMGKVYFPRLVTPVATAFSRLISFGIQFAMLIAFWLFYLIRGGTDIAVTPKLLLIPLLILQMMVLSVGLGIIVSSVTTKYRDLSMLVAFGLQLWHYATPVAYGLSLASGMADRHPVLTQIYMLNPVLPVITTFRWALFGFGYFNIGYYLAGWAVSLALFFIGLVLFSRIERTFTDTV